MFVHSKAGLGSEEILQTYLEIWSVSGGLLKTYDVDELKSTCILSFPHTDCMFKRFFINELTLPNLFFSSVYYKKQFLSRPHLLT